MKTFTIVLLSLFSLIITSHSYAEDPLIRNGDFSEGAKYWYVLANGGYRSDEQLGDALQVEPGKSLALDIKNLVTKEPTKPAHLTLNQRVTSLTHGMKYVLRFDVRSSEPGTLLAALGNPVLSGPNKSNLSGGFSLQEVAVGPQWNEVKIEFIYNGDKTLTLPADSEKTVLQLRVGTLSDLEVRSVSLELTPNLP
jgi:hypothetical protein